MKVRQDYIGPDKMLRPEKHYYGGYTVVDCHKMREIIDCRLYATAQTTYCCIWVRGGDSHLSGTSKVSGYGFNREHDAITLALRDIFDDVVEINGDNVIKQRLKEAAEAALEHINQPNDKLFVVHSHP